MKAIFIDSRDLAYTIDTYATFTGEGVEETEAEYYREEYDLDDIEFDYDHAEVVKALAIQSVALLQHELIDNGDGIVRSIALKATASPQFYNYTTDSYTALWVIDEQALANYCQITEHFREWIVFGTENWPLLNYDNETDVIVARLDFYTHQEYDPELYEDIMYERETECWIENMKLTPESQVLMDAKEQTA